MERLPSNKSNGDPSPNPSTHALPSHSREHDESGDERKALPIRPAKANNATTPAQNPETRDHFPCPAGQTRFRGILRNAGKGPKYIRTLPLTIIASCPIASTSTSTSPRKKCSACESQ